MLINNIMSSTLLNALNQQSNLSLLNPTSSINGLLNDNSLTSQFPTTLPSSSNVLSSLFPPTFNFLSSGPPSTTPADTRLRISPQNVSFYGNSGLLQPLMTTDGVLFPFSPQVNFEQSVDYTQAGGGVIQSNMDYYAYSKTPSISINIVGKFAIQSQVEGQYIAAVIHFFRVASKMYFGEAAAAQGTAGLPPPTLFLNGYGTYMFNNLPCILRSHSFNYTPEVDLITIPVAGGVIQLPALFDLSVNLTYQQTPYNMSNTFDLNAFRTGQLMAQGGYI